MNIKCVFGDSLEPLSEMFLIIRRISEIWSYMCRGLHEKYPLFLSDFNEIWNLSKDFKKYSIIKFHENSTSASRAVLCGRTDMTQQIVVFRNFVKGLNAVPPASTHTSLEDRYFIKCIPSVIFGMWLTLSLKQGYYVGLMEDTFILIASSSEAI